MDDFSQNQGGHVSRPSMPPIMELDRGHLMWKKVRVPLFVGIGLLVLAAMGVVVGFWIRAAAIRSTVQEARDMAALDTVEGLHSSVEMLGGLAADYRLRGDVQAAYAYVLALDALENGSLEPGLEEARKALGRSDPGSGGDLYHAATILLHVVGGENDEARKIADSLDPDTRMSGELRLARAMSRIETGQNLEAQVDLELMAASPEPFLPAVTVLAMVRHRLGNLEGARQLLDETLEKHPGRLRAELEKVLVLVDIGTGESLAEADGLLDGLTTRIATAPPVLATRGRYARGLLLMARGEYGKAAGPLCEALEGMPGDAVAAARCARARRLSGDPSGASAVLDRIRFGEGTPTVALVESVEADLQLWRPREASVALELLSSRPDVDGGHLLDLRATALLQSGDFAGAAAAFASAGGSGDVPLRAALAYIEAGDAKTARELLQALKQGPSAGCAASLRDWSRGKLGQALGELGQDDACAGLLRGRFLFNLGRHAEAVAEISKVVAARDDPRLDVLLARATYRTSGPDAARAILEAIGELGAESVVLLGDVALAYVEMGFTDDARGAAADAVERNPGKPDALALQARILRLTGDPQTAAEIATKALEAHPDHPGLLVERAYAHLAQGEYGEAFKLGQRAMKPGPCYLDAALVTGMAFEAKGSEADADVVLRDAGLELLRSHEPTLAPVLWAALIEMRRLRGGKPNLVKARGLFWGLAKREIPGAAFYFQGGVVMFADGRREDALHWFHEAAALDPAYEPPFEKLSKMGELTEEEVRAYTAVHGVAP
jgi:tetratricopeptide (TPR) repeat protein